MSQWLLNLIGILSFVFIWLPLFFAAIAFFVIVAIDALRTKHLQEKFYNSLPYHYRSVIDAYKGSYYSFFKLHIRDTFILQDSKQFKEYEENTKKFVDEEL